MSAETELFRICPVCHADSSAPLWRPSKSPGPIVECKKCGFIYVNPIENGQSLILDGPVLGNRTPQQLTSSNLSDIDGTWEKPLIEKYLKEAPERRLNYQKAIKIIRKFIGPSGKLLDIGCFCGLFLNEVAKSGWECCGIEPLVSPAIYARANFGINVITDTLKEDIYPPESFDVVTAFQVFEHLVFPDEYLKIIANILKPGGLLVIEVPNIDTLLVKILMSKHRHFVEDHVSFFSPSTLNQMLENFGFTILEYQFPSRVMSIDHLLEWVGFYNKNIEKVLRMPVNSSHPGLNLQLNLKDIVFIVAQKNLA
jgi:2-polyprenyl-3-methyl-5-hydroxy-6-metoxy-1,4-benzoquinol methylase